MTRNTYEKHVCQKCWKFKLCDRYQGAWICTDCLNPEEKLEIQVTWGSNGNMEGAGGDANGLGTSRFRTSVNRGAARVGGRVHTFNFRPGRRSA